MRDQTRIILSLGLALLAAAAANIPLRGQDAESGIAMPFTATGGILVSDRAKAADAQAARMSAGLRVALYPGVKISPAWFVHSTVQVQEKPFFYYQAFYPKKELTVLLQDLFVGYRRTGEESAFGLKVGKLPSAFGAFPLRYADTSNPLLDQPFAYAYPAKLRPDQMPCGVADLVHQQVYPTYVDHYCGGSTTLREGMTPVTLYGLPAAEVDMAWQKLDGRVQLTNSSPANPQDLQSDSQHLQWTAGAGYTIRQGLRVGLSGFRGPFLEKSVIALLSLGTNVRDYPATGIGTDVQWASGRWSANAEWQRVEFNYPRFRTPPAISSSYIEVKSILNPRFYAALRAGYERHGHVEDLSGVRSDQFLPNRQAYEFALGYHVNHFQTLKAGYEWLKTNGIAGARNNVFGVQFVTSVNSLSKGF